jgi:hypothetical protein
MLVLCDAFGPEVAGEVELVGLEVVSVEEDDGFGSGVVDADNSCGLRQERGTSLMERRSRTTRLIRWNFCCCEILLYL